MGRSGTATILTVNITWHAGKPFNLPPLVPMARHLNGSVFAQFARAGTGIGLGSLTFHVPSYLH